MATPLKALKAQLLTGIKASRQSSYERGAPSKESIPILSHVRAELRAYLMSNPTDADAWRYLAQAEECLLNYREAIDCLHRVVELSKGDRRSTLKTLARLRQYVLRSVAGSLSDEQVTDLGSYLTSCGLETPKGTTTLERTTEWLLRTGIDVSKILSDFRRLGVETDYEVLNRIVKTRLRTPNNS